VIALVQQRKANAFRFKDDGIILNHPVWPLIVYHGPVRFPPKLDPAAVLEELFKSYGWGNSWRNGIYDYVHYHSQIHEVLGTARGTAKVNLIRPLAIAGHSSNCGSLQGGAVKSQKLRAVLVDLAKQLIRASRQIQ
jgi:hypothetical protein